MSARKKVLYRVGRGAALYRAQPDPKSTPTCHGCAFEERATLCRAVPCAGDVPFILKAIPRGLPVPASVEIVPC